MPNEPDAAEPVSLVATKPFVFLVVANGLTAAALGISMIPWATEKTEAAAVMRMVPLIFAALATVYALSTRLRSATWDFAGRVETSACVSFAGLAALGGFLTMGYARNDEGNSFPDPDWISGHMFYMAAFVALFAAALVVLLPTTPRRIVIAIAVVFHFTGMAVCFSSIDPPHGQGPWLSKQLWMRVYRPYLSFLYLTNAYHFYSPDPAAPSMFWFYVHFDDGSMTLVKIPDRDTSLVGMQYGRLQALPEHTWSPLTRLPFTSDEYRMAGAPLPLRGGWEHIYKRRRDASKDTYFDPETGKGFLIPMVSDIDVSSQYREPADISKRLVASVARRVLYNTKPPAPGVKATSIKMYRVTLEVLSPAELVARKKPHEPTKLWPYFIGEFDPQGRMVVGPNRGELDPFLYWFLPVVRVKPDYPRGYTDGLGTPSVSRYAVDMDNELLDAIKLHANGRGKK